jgi:predicted nucleotidyltransferase
MINIEPKHLQIIKTILSHYNYSFYVFGSRITQKAKRFSDIDLLYFENIPSDTLLKLEEEFEESDLPYKVDLVNYNQCDEDFKKIIGSNYVPLQSASKLQVVE